LKDGKNVFVGAHGNSIRALVKHIKGLSDDEIMDVEIPNFPPLVFEFDEKLNVVSEYYLGK
ncbi:MAG: phosphoglycerate mutase, partial [Streptococcus vestibularis]|nr:phosphoglycerate mutase [Streptococcus vestibularis]